jgi:hypothetical protein
MCYWTRAFSKFCWLFVLMFFWPLNPEVGVSLTPEGHGRPPLDLPSAWKSRFRCFYEKCFFDLWPWHKQTHFNFFRNTLSSVEVISLQKELRFKTIDIFQAVVSQANYAPYLDLAEESHHMIWFVVTHMYTDFALMMTKITNRTPIHICNRPIHFRKEKNRHQLRVLENCDSTWRRQCWLDEFDRYWMNI